MAAPTGLLTAQLRNKLCNEDEKLSKRLEVAHTVFRSSAIPIAQKEEEVLSWILGTIQTSETEKEELYSCLSKCLTSNRMLTYNGTIRPAVIGQLITALSCDEECSDNVRSVIRDCSVAVLSVPFFQRWFMCDMQSASKTAANYFNAVIDSESAADFSKVIKHLLYIQRLSLLKAELRVRFIKELMIPMCKALTFIPPETRALFQNEMMVCWREMLFYEPKFMENYIKINLSKDSECNKDVKSFNKKLRHLPTKESREVVEVFYSLFLRAVVSKYPDDFNRIFRVFTFLCPPLGIIVDRIISIEMSPVANWDVDNSFYIIKTLIDILDNSKIPLTCNLEEVSLQNWFTSLVIGLTSINSRTMSINFFNMVKRVYDFNPLVIEPSCKIIAMIMLRKKPVELVPSYVDLISTVIKGSSKLQRLQKFVSFFLENMKDYLMMSCDDDLTLEDVLPSAVCDEFSKVVSFLPTAQVLAMTKSFLFHLQRDCLNQVESSCTDTSLTINVEVISALLELLLRNSNMIHHSVPDVVKTKYKHLLEELQGLLKRFGTVYEDLHVDRLLKSYLSLCKTFGAMKLLFREYDDIQIVKPIDVDLEPTNISYVHNYLHPDSWKRIADSIEEHDSCGARHQFFELLMQKVEAVSQVEEGYEGPGTQAARYILHHSDIEWLWSQLLLLAPLFQSAELVKLVSKMIRHFSNDQSPWLPLLKQDPFTENRRLVLAVEFSLLSKASKKISSGKEEEEECLSRQVMSLISIEEVLEFELSQLITEDEELRESVEGFITEMAALLNENLLSVDQSQPRKVPHSSFFEVGARLPMQHLSCKSQSCALLAAVALLHDLPPDTDVDLLLFNLLLKITDGPQKGNGNLLSELNPGILVRFLAERGAGYRGLRKLLKRISSLAFHERKPAKQLLSAVNDPTPQTLWITAIVIDSLIQLKKKFIGREDCKKPLERKKCVEHLIEQVLPVICSVEPSPDHLYPFSVLFNYVVRYLPTLRHHFNLLLPLLNGYIPIATSDYKGDGERLIEGLIEHRAELETSFPDGLVSATFNLISAQLLPPTETLLHLLFATATSQEFSTILSSLIVETKGKELEEDGERCRRLMSLWSLLCGALLSSDKCRQREDALGQLVQRLAPLPQLWARGTALHLVRPLADLFAVITKNTSIVLKGFVVDSILTIVGSVPVEGDIDSDEMRLDRLSAAIDALLALFLFRSTLLADRLPPFLQRYRHSLTALARLVSNSPTYIFIRKAVPLAEKLERIATAMVKKRKDFSRLSPYLIADFMTIFQKYSLPSELKFCYTNIVNAFLSISDSHAVAFLKAVLPSGQQELFNGIYENYNKFHRYGGNV